MGVKNGQQREPWIRFAPQAWPQKDEKVPFCLALPAHELISPHSRLYSVPVYQSAYAVLALCLSDRGPVEVSALLLFTRWGN